MRQQQSSCHRSDIRLLLADGHSMHELHLMNLRDAHWHAGAAGYLLPLSGGADSSSTAAIVGCMCQMVARAAADGDQRVVADARRCRLSRAELRGYLKKNEGSSCWRSVVAPARDPRTLPTTSLKPLCRPLLEPCSGEPLTFLPVVPCRIGQYSEGEQIGSAEEFASRVFTTAYMGTENSSAETRQRAATLAREIGAHHLDLNIDTVIAAMTALFAAVTGRRPAFKVRAVTSSCC